MANEFDVVICGSGSAGLMAAVWLSQYGISCKILESRTGPMTVGQADGIQCRTVEIFESFGIAEDLLREAYHVLELTFWSDHGGKLKRDRSVADREAGVSHQPHVILNQARVNKMLLDLMKRANGQDVDYGYEVLSVTVDPERVTDYQAHAVTVVTLHNGKQVEFKAKFVLGCDGAHSAVRRSLGFKMIGDSTNVVWGVMDVYPITNFPDARRKCIITSSVGTLMMIPREGGSLTRYYFEMPGGTDPKKVQLSHLHGIAREIFSPFTLEFADTVWWSAYSIGQRLADGFHKSDRVFLTGDACHTHSPKAGQGMNVSLQDGYNLGWKLGSFLTGQVHFDVVRTYVSERSATAANLIEFDRKWSRLYAKANRNESSITTEQFTAEHIKNARYMAGMTATYEETVITTSSSNSAQKLAKNLVVGMRFPSTQVVRHCDAKALQLSQAFLSDGRWRLVVFAGDLGESVAAQRLQRLADFLSSPNSFILSLAATDLKNIDSFIEPILVLSSDRSKLQQDDIPDYFWPVTGKWRMRDLHKTYIDGSSYNSDHGHAYDLYGIDPSAGAVIIVRPDQHISAIVDIDDHMCISIFFRRFVKLR